MKQTVIASYPRSGSTYLRFLLTHVLYEGDHDINSVNRHIPTLENDEEVLNGIDKPVFYKTHRLRNCQNVIFLHRHVGDCLISEYHYHKDFLGDEKTLDEFLEALEYGKNWRDMVEHYYPCENVSFNDLKYKTDQVIRKVMKLAEKHGGLCSLQSIVERVNFDNLKKTDDKFFREGKTGQWFYILTDEQKQKLFELNRKHLKILGYGSTY